MTDAADLSTLLSELAARFPPEHPLALQPPAGDDAWAPLAARFPGGHARRWYAATDGQANRLPAVDTHTFCSLSEARRVLEIADAIRAEPDGYWVEPHWLAIAADGAGQHLMIDDRDGRVLSVAHDDDHIDVLAESPEAWLASLQRDLDEGVLVVDATFGLIDAAELAGIEARREARRARDEPGPLPLKHKIGLTVCLLVIVVFMAALIWLLETNR